ncbi:FAS1-like dehydratase domain-containing protein [Haladaptatus sp. ZSTT2]|uniref:FAS1-like dehydratase domain-containing protein n=1 Tax=Haladaptatus sp. ZSTT2 TaxID=3120515 RepID=UPI00300E9CB0
MPTKALETLKSLVGETRETVQEFRVERGKIVEFAAAIHATNPIHTDVQAAREQGYADVVAPLTFAKTSYFPHNRPEGIDENLGFDLGFEPSRIVHGEQAFEYERPLVAGDVLNGETTLTDVYQRESNRAGTMTFACYETRFVDRDGDLVLTSETTRIETGQAISEADDA